MTSSAFEPMPPQRDSVTALQPLHDRYQLLQPLGKKAGRQTWLAMDLATQEQVVVKLLTFSGDFRWEDLKLFEREAETLKALDHPAIPRYQDYFEFDSPTTKGFALVQTYIPAQSLEQQLQAGRVFTEAEVQQLANALLAILDYLHTRQPAVIHRDIKPSNILLTNRSGNSPGQVYLVDFGSVQTLAATEGGTITVVGTYGYMPPEQFGGRTVPASDLYSLGATLLYLVTGQHPADLLQADLRLDSTATNGLSPRFRTWLCWLTEPSLSQRPDSAQEAASELDRSDLNPVDSALPLQQPRHSQIQVARQRNCLTLLIPARQMTLSGDRPWLVLVALILLFSPLTFWGMGFLLVLVLMRLCRRSQLVIDRQEIIIAQQLFHWQYGRARRLPRRYIWKLERLRRDRHRLRLWIGTETCDFYGTQTELNWLAYELGHWLNLPIEQ